MADLLHADDIQQLEVALLGSPALEVIDLLSGGLAQARPVTVWQHQLNHIHTLIPLLLLHLLQLQSW